MKGHGDVGMSLWVMAIDFSLYTVCPGISDPAEKIFSIFESENEVYTIY